MENATKNKTVKVVISSANNEHISRDVELTDHDAFYASGVATTKTVHVDNDFSVTSFVSVEDEGKRYAISSSAVYEACKDHEGEECSIILNESGAITAVVLSDRTIAIDTGDPIRTRFLIAAAVIVLLAIVIFALAH